MSQIIIDDTKGSDIALLDDQRQTNKQHNQSGLAATQSRSSRPGCGDTGRRSSHVWRPSTYTGTPTDQHQLQETEARRSRWWLIASQVTNPASSVLADEPKVHVGLIFLTDGSYF